MRVLSPNRYKRVLYPSSRYTRALYRNHHKRVKNPKAPEEKGILGTAFDIGVEIFKLLGMIFMLFGLILNLILVLILNMLRFTVPCCAQITKRSLSVIKFVFGLLWWLFSTFGGCILSKMIEKAYGLIYG